MPWGGRRIAGSELGCPQDICLRAYDQVEMEPDELQVVRPVGLLAESVKRDNEPSVNVSSTVASLLHAEEDAAVRTEPACVVQKLRDAIGEVVQPSIRAAVPDAVFMGRKRCPETRENDARHLVVGTKAR